MLKPCKGCGGEFEATGLNHAYCGFNCRQRAWRAARAQLKPRHCVSCSQPFERVTVRQRRCTACTVRTCMSCNESFTPSDRQRRCVACIGKRPSRDRTPRVPLTACLHCGDPINNAGSTRMRYCSGACRTRAFKARHGGKLGDDGEIIVADLEESPRRLRVAKAFDYYGGGGAFEHVTPPRWLSPPRAGR